MDLSTYADKLEIPQISEESKERLDSPITMDKIGKALFELENNKVPGTDGFQPEFYKMFYEKLK